MRVMVLVKATSDSETGILPTPEMFDAMDRYNEELKKAGILRDADGLKPSSEGKRVAFDNIAVGSVTGREAKSLSVSGGAVTPGTTDGTTPYANGECGFTSPQTVSAAGSAYGREHTLRTVCGDRTTDFTTDRSH